MEIVFAPKIATSFLQYLDDLITDFIVLFKRLFFPDINSINKFHHIQHYADCIRWAGPLINYWCMRYEAKHGQYKLKAQNMYNFKNPPKTLMRTGQCAQSAKWGAKNVKLNKVKILSSKLQIVNETQSKNNLQQLGYSRDDIVLTPSKILVNGVEFSKNFYVVIETAQTREDKSLLFGCIQEIIHIENQDGGTYVLCSVYTSILDPYVNAYRLKIEDPVQHKFIKVSDLPYYRTFCSWRKRTSDDVYISLRNIVI